MANRTAKLYIRNKVGYRKPPKRITDLPENEAFVLFWYEGTRKKAKAVGRFADEAQVALNNKEAQLKNLSITGIAPVVVAPEPAQEPTAPAVLTVCEAVKEYLANVEGRVGNDGYGAAPKTLTAYRKRLSFLLEFDGITPVTEVNRKYFERFRAFLRSRLENDRYTYNVLQSANIFFRTLGITCCGKILRETGYAPKIVEAYKEESLNLFFFECSPEEKLVFKFFLHSMAREREVAHTEVADLLWQERNQVVTSISWVSRIEDAKDSLLRSRWDLIIVDEAHKMAAYSADKKTLAYRLGEALSGMTDHFLLMTATPHKGDPENFCLFLELLDRDVYGNVKSLEEAMRRNYAPFYLRRTKEALVSFPDPETGQVKKLFTNRTVSTASFDLDGDEYDFYDALTRYVEDQSIKAAQEDSPRARALTFTMAMLQRRFASSIYAVRHSLERMRNKRKKILEDPREFLRKQLEIPEDLDELTDEEREEYIEQIENAAISFDPTVLKEDIQQISRLIDQARTLEQREVESKLVKLKKVLNELEIFSNPKMKLLIFTEHKDTLDYLAGDGRDDRPLGKLLEWGLKVTQIHGGMKVGDRDTPGTRIYAERDSREDAQVLVATEAAGEGINLQFCWLMINYDIPWNPVRLEQRMGRIHRYGQEHDCVISNFVAINTREGRVLQKLHERLAEIRQELGTDQVFDVVGEVFPSNLLEKLFREMYAKRTDLPNIEARIVREVDAGIGRRICATSSKRTRASSN